MMNQFAIVLAAAGSSTRFADVRQKKVFVAIQNKPLWLFSAEKFAERDDVVQIILVVSPDDKVAFCRENAAEIARLNLVVATGGAQRADSVQNGLRELEDHVNFIAIHDAARPCITRRDIDAVFDAAITSGAALLATRCASTIKREDGNGRIIDTVPRDLLWLAQTPQVFSREILEQAYCQHPNPSLATDEASLVEHLLGPGKISLVEGSPMNIKVTTQADLQFIRHVLATDELSS